MIIFFPEKITYKFNYQKEHFWRCHYTSTNSKSLHYKILLPLTVKPVSVEPVPVEGFDNFYTIGCYQTVSESQSPFMEVSVIYENIENDIDAVNRPVLVPCIFLDPGQIMVLSVFLRCHIVQ